MNYMVAKLGRNRQSSNFSYRQNGEVSEGCILLIYSSINKKQYDNDIDKFMPGHQKCRKKESNVSSSAVSPNFSLFTRCFLRLTEVRLMQ